MIPVTCISYRDFHFHINDMKEYQSLILFIQTIRKNTNPLSYSYKRYGRIPIPYLNYMQQPNIV